MSKLTDDPRARWEVRLVTDIECRQPLAGYVVSFYWRLPRSLLPEVNEQYPQDLLQHAVVYHLSTLFAAKNGRDLPAVNHSACSHS